MAQLSRIWEVDPNQRGVYGRQYQAKQVAEKMMEGNYAKAAGRNENDIRLGDVVKAMKSAGITANRGDAHREMKQGNKSASVMAMAAGGNG